MCQVGCGSFLELESTLGIFEGHQNLMLAVPLKLFAVGCFNDCCSSAVYKATLELRLEVFF